MTLSKSALAVCCYKRLLQLAGSTIELLLQVGNRGAATTHDLCRIAARRRYRSYGVAS